jgi:serine/threonine protein kinase
VADVARELIRCVADLHAVGVVHRDLKPSNVLVSMTKRGGDHDREVDEGEEEQQEQQQQEEEEAISREIARVTLCDLGMARRLPGVRAGSAVPCQLEGWTDYVTTRWYRAPEVICRCRGGQKDGDGAEDDPRRADMWAVGCIVAELLIGSPVLPGKDAETQLEKIAGAIGKMVEKSTKRWYLDHAEDDAGAHCLLDFADAAADPSTSLATTGVVDRASRRLLVSRLRVRRVDEAAIDLIRRLLDYRPDRRPTAAEALRHRAFHSTASIASTAGTTRSGTGEDDEPVLKGDTGLDYADDDGEDADAYDVCGGDCSVYLRGAALLSARSMMLSEMTRCNAELSRRIRAPAAKGGVAKKRKRVLFRMAASPPPEKTRGPPAAPTRRGEQG